MLFAAVKKWNEFELIFGSVMQRFSQYELLIVTITFCSKLVQTVKYSVKDNYSKTTVVKVKK